MTQKVVSSVDVGYADVVAVSTGSDDAGKIVALAENGKLDPSVLPISASVPSGVVLMWSGTVASIPDGWHICDGTSGTPDLRGRFIVGVGSDAGAHTTGVNGLGGGYYCPGDIGGEDLHQMTIAEMPSHNHSNGYNVPYGSQYTVSPGSGYNGYNLIIFNSMNNGSENPPQPIWTYGGQVSSGGISVGGGGAHENRPPYYALAYIMKL